MKTIREIEKELSMLRESWKDAKPDKRSKWMAKINLALDERNQAKDQLTKITLPTKAI